MEPDKEIGKLLQGFQPALVLMTANELGLFDAIAKGPRTAEEISGDLKLSLKGTERLLNAVVSLGMATLQDGRYALGDPWKPFLTQDGARSMRQWIRLVADHLPVWMRLDEFAKNGAPLTSIMQMLGGDPVKMRTFIDAMHDKALNAPQRIAQQVPLDSYRKLLDIGGGPGTYSLEWAKAFPQLHATVFDIAPVVAVARDYIQRYGLADRVNTHAGDFTKDPLPEGFDLVLIANVLHMYDAPTAQSLVAKAAAALLPGGRLIIQGFGTEADSASPILDVMFSLQIGMLTEGGRAHPFPEVEGWLRDNGLTDIQHTRIDALPTGILTGVKPA